MKAKDDRMDLIKRSCGREAGKAVLLLAVLGLAGLAGCEGKYKPSLTDDEARKFIAKQKPLAPPVLSVSGDTITLDDVISVRARGRTLGDYLTTVAQNSDPETYEKIATTQVKGTLDRIIFDTLLYQQAKREGGDKMKEGVEKYGKTVWREYVMEQGGDESAAEEALRKNGLDRKSWDEQNKRIILIGYIRNLRQAKDQPVSHREMVEYYERMKDTDFLIKPRLTFRLIDIQPSRLQLKDLTADRYSQASELAKDLTAKLAAGEDFIELAKQYSHDPMAASGGLWESVDPESLAEPYSSLAAEIAALKVGELKGPLSIKGHLFIVRLEAKTEQGYKSLAEVQAEVEKAILADRKRQAEDELQAGIAERAKVGQTDDFVNGCVAEIYRRSRAAS
jgi:hypothetical protein